MDRRRSGWLEAQPRPFDLFVVDVLMPEMRGDELSRQLRQRDPDVKVLYFTGYADRLFEDRTTPWEHEVFVENPERSRDCSKPCPCCCPDTQTDLLPVKVRQRDPYAPRGRV
jgi:response regulator RpfG family c-di-GMP phosphodiesterase